ncbi:MAG: type II toxin-antitoxin system death-on-curing family toxin [Firmicutes bacterium]|nr:type II toxin-antitoxin system death-on-curing family toxin [Bacillota bacterium]
MTRLKKEQVLLLHHLTIRYHGGLDGIRDEGLLESALYAPFASFGGADAYPTIESKAARLAFGLIKNHPFMDGNKRTGILSMLSFLRINGITPKCTDDELVEIGRGVADGTIDEMYLLSFIHERR